ncbi:MAG: polysaccharide biosynthesis/export family protein [Planctomycetes bacterium]|nr:polysaccharide biosynthesis/export family protein [Planctomycetota bacterium]
MIDSAEGRLRQHCLASSLARCAMVVGLIGVLPVGCSDHRISLAKFMEIQNRAPVEAPAPTQEELRTISELIDRQLGPERVGPEDVLLISFTSMEAVALLAPLSVRVDRNGEIDLPLVGAVQVGGLELEDVDDRVRNAYVPSVFRDAVVFVGLVAPKVTNVVVRGAVAAPGLVPLRRTERNLLFAVMGAGGSAELASGEVTLQRVRRASESVRLNLRDPKDLQTALSLDPLEDGDIVTVHAAMPNTIFVGGLVTAPRSQTYTSGVKMNVLQVLAAAGGLRTDISPKEGTLIRRMPDGKDLQVKLNLDRIASGRDPNFLLAPGDILWVPYTWATRIQEFFSRNVFLTAGATVSYTATGIDFLNRRQLQSLRSFRGGTVEDTLDPFGFINSGAAQSTIIAPPPGP